MIDLYQQIMVLSGVCIVLGYKISEEELRAEYEEGFKEYIVALKAAEDIKKRRKKADRYTYQFDKYDFDNYISFLIYGTDYLKNPSICHWMPCCAYDNNWVIGLRICYFDGFDFDPCDVSGLRNSKEKLRSVKQIFKKLGLGVICDDDEPEFYSIANDCRRCS